MSTLNTKNRKIEIDATHVLMVTAKNSRYGCLNVGKNCDLTNRLFKIYNNNLSDLNKKGQVEYRLNPMATRVHKHNSCQVAGSLDQVFSVEKCDSP